MDTLIGIRRNDFRDKCEQRDSPGTDSVPRRYFRSPIIADQPRAPIYISRSQGWEKQTVARNTSDSRRKYSLTMIRMRDKTWITDIEEFTRRGRRIKEKGRDGGYTYCWVRANDRWSSLITADTRNDVCVNEDRRGSISGEWIIRDRSGWRGMGGENWRSPCPHLVPYGLISLPLSFIVTKFDKNTYPVVGDVSYFFFHL